MSSIDESVSDTQYTTSGIQHSGKSNAILLTGALHAEVTEGRKQDVIDDYLHRAQLLCSLSDKEAQRLVTAGIVPTVILLLRARALGAPGLETALITLGMLAYA
jgi:predicted amidohydrolase